MRSSLVRTFAFVRSELVATLRQPRLLLVLVLGPFLVLFLFGLGYDHQLPALSTIVVGSPGELTDRVDDYIRQQQPAGIDYEGTTQDQETALSRLRDGDVDLVIVLPDEATETIGRNQRAVIEVHQRSLDPVTFSQIAVASDSAVSQINDAVLEHVVGDVQDQTAGVDEQLRAVREGLGLLRGLIGTDDLAALQETAQQLAGQVTTLADRLETTAGLAARIGLTDDLDRLVSGMRASADGLAGLSAREGIEQLEEAAATLDEVDALVTQLRDLEPAVAVRPFQAEVVSQTPQPVTLDRFFAPGLVALMLQHLGVTFAALAIVRDRQGGLSEMLRVAPVSIGERLAGKTIAFLILGGLVAAALTGLIVAAFDVPLPVSWVAFASLIALALLASLGFGYLVAALSASDGQAVQFAMLLLLGAIFFSGLFMPLDRIGMPVELVSWAMPATHAFLGLQHLMLLGERVPIGLYAGLGVIVLITFAAARLLLPRRERLA